MSRIEIFVNGEYEGGIDVDIPAPPEKGTWFVDTNLVAEMIAPCGRVKRDVPVAAPLNVVFQGDPRLCDGCVCEVTAREPKPGSDAQIEISETIYLGKCPIVSNLSEKKE